MCVWYKYIYRTAHQLNTRETERQWIRKKRKKITYTREHNRNEQQEAIVTTQMGGKASTIIKPFVQLKNSRRGEINNFNSYFVYWNMTFNSEINERLIKKFTSVVYFLAHVCIT